MTNPFVSVVMPTYNNGKSGFLEAAVKSVLSQEYKKFELIIIDDGSTDNTKEVCARFLDDKRVRCIHQKNCGRSGARNRGISESNGEYICFLDDDDLWTNDKLKKQVDFFLSSSDPKIGIVTIWEEIIDENDHAISYRGKKEEGEVYKKIFYDNMVNCSGAMIKRSVFDKVGLFDEHFVAAEDWDLWIRIAKHYHIYQIREYLVKYRVHSKNISNNADITFKFGEDALLKNLKDAPDTFDKKDILGNYYIDQSEPFYASYDMKSYRKCFLKGLINSPKRLKVRHVFKFLLSYIPKPVLSKIQSVKRGINS